MRIYLLGLIGAIGWLLNPVESFGQITPKEKPAIALPKHWLGNWKGKLEIAKTGADTQVLDMELWISPGPSPDRWDWKSYMGQGADKVKKEYRKVYIARSGKKSLKSVGGLKGGHVEVHINGQVYGFTDRPQAKVPHFFAHNQKKSNGLFLKISEADWQTKNKTSQITFFKFPLRLGQRDSLQQQYEANIQASPYDFALFGMRCASSAYDMLAQFGILEKRSRRKTVMGIFHPRAFRKEVRPWMQEKGYSIEIQTGIEEKQWDK
ncbi:MAG: hypothetical protein AAFU64_12960 [Bacteroidota bacterium]